MSRLQPQKARASNAYEIHYTGTVAGGGAPLTLIARVGGSDANKAPGPMISRGGSAALTFEVQNTGVEELWGLWVSVPSFGAVACAERHLVPGAYGVLGQRQSAAGKLRGQCPRHCVQRRRGRGGGARSLPLLCAGIRRGECSDRIPGGRPQR